MQGKEIKWEMMPMILSAKDLCDILRIGQVKAYELLNQEGFPTVKLGRTQKVYREALRNWLSQGSVRDN